MPRGKYVNHKGKSRHFTNPDDLERERRKEMEEQRNKWRNKKEDEEEDESSEEDEGAAAASVPAKSADKKGESGSEEESESEETDSEDEANRKKKGVEGLIQIENPNRVRAKTKKPSKVVVSEEPDELEDTPSSSSTSKVTPSSKASSSVKPELSRREREELEKQRAKAHYQKLHAEGKTEEAQADLARLALVRKQREEAAAKREEEKRAKESAQSAKKDQVDKALGKR